MIFDGILCMNFIRFLILFLGVLSSLSCAIGLPWIDIKGYIFYPSFFNVSISGFILGCVSFTWLF